jgi:hypothetical protein
MSPFGSTLVSVKATTKLPLLKAATLGSYWRLGAVELTKNWLPSADPLGRKVRPSTLL